MQRSLPSERRVVLVRHGRSAHVQAGWIDVGGFREWRAAYDAAGIREDERAPAALRELVCGSVLVVSSDAPRALGSARLLAPAGEVLVSPLLRELDFENPSLFGFRFPLAAWAVAVGGRTLVQTLRGRFPSATEAARLGAAALWLDEIAAEHPLIVAVTHASFRGRLGKRLVQVGWRAEPGRRTFRHWSAWHFTRPGRLS